MDSLELMFFEGQTNSFLQKLNPSLKIYNVHHRINRISQLVPLHCVLPLQIATACGKDIEQSLFHKTKESEGIGCFALEIHFCNE